MYPVEIVAETLRKELIVLQARLDAVTKERDRAVKALRKIRAALTGGSIDDMDHAISIAWDHLDDAIRDLEQPKEE